METIQFIGTQNQLVNLKNAIEFTDNDMPQQAETRVYVLNHLALPKGKEEEELLDEEYMAICEEQGTVHTLESFQKAFNKEDNLSTSLDYIRFITVPYYQ